MAVGSAVKNQVAGEFALGQERIGDNVFATEIKVIEGQDGHADLVGLF